MDNLTPEEVAALRNLVAPTLAAPPAPIVTPRPAPESDPALDDRMAKAINEALDEADKMLARPERYEGTLDALATELPNHTRSLPSREHVAALVLDTMARQDPAFGAELERWLAPAVQTWPMSFSDSDSWRRPALATVVRNHVRKALLTNSHVR